MRPDTELVRGAVRVAISAGACIALLRSTVAAAAEDGCTLSGHAEGLGVQWTYALDAVRADLARREDVDHCASILLERAPGGARMVVVLGDGRSTERVTSDPRDLQALATALLLLPTRSEAPTTSEPSVAPELPIAPTLQATQVDPAHAARRPAHEGIELGGAGGPRWSGAAPAVGVGLFADTRLGELMLGVHGRWDGYAQDTSSVDPFTTQALEVGAEVGRDLHIGKTRLTMLAGPSFVALSQKLQAAHPSIDGKLARAAPRDGQVLRVGGIVRWTFLSQTRWNLFAAADAEVDVTSDDGNRFSAQPDASLLPVWSAGLSLGASVGVWP